MKTCKDCGKEIKSRNICNTCRQRRWREAHPFKYHWKNHKNRAEQRGHEWTLTLEQFKELWQKHPKKWELKKDPNVVCEWELDRINENRGYHHDNVQIIKKLDNLQKFHQFKSEEKMYTETEAPF